MTLLVWPVISKKVGIDIDPINDDKDEYFVKINVITHDTAKIIPNKILIENRIPTYVATPLPPLNLSQIGNT